MSNSDLGPGIPCESIQAIANRCFTDRWMCTDASAGVSISKPVIYAIDFRRVPPQKTIPDTTARQIFRSGTMGGLCMITLLRCSV